MLEILSKESTYINDKFTIDNICSEDKLIYKAGHALYLSYDYKGKTLIVVGKGNNGGDGLALGLELKENNKYVEILTLYDFKSSILINLYNECIKSNITIHKYTNDFDFNKYDTIVDGIFGIGYKIESLDDYIKNIIININKSKAYKISIDINSGLDCNSGKTKCAIKSNLTVAIGSYKYGHFLNDAKDYIDKLVVCDIGIIEAKHDYVYLVDDEYINDVLKKRNQNVHKGSFGYVGVMGGSNSYSGSIKLSDLGLTSLISGAGVSRIIVPSSISKYIYPDIFESTLQEIKSNNRGGFRFNKKQIDKSISGLKSLGFGMGIGKSKDNIKILKYLLNNFKGNLVIDADGINTLSKIDLDILNKTNSYVILTPHVKEFSRLINILPEDILDDPIYYVRNFINKYKCVLVLKGTSTIVGYSNRIFIIDKGSNALSKGGSGDILSGVITGIGGYCNSIESALTGCYLFGLAGQRCYEEYGSYSTLPTDTIKMLKEIMKSY